MNQEKIFQFVVSMFVELFELEAKDIHLESTIFDELGLDSLDMVDLVIEMQSKFKFKIEREVDEEKMRAIRTVRDLCLLIEQKIAAGGVDVSKMNP